MGERRGRREEKRKENEKRMRKKRRGKEKREGSTESCWKAVLNSLSFSMSEFRSWSHRAFSSSNSFN